MMEQRMFHLKHVLLDPSLCHPEHREGSAHKWDLLQCLRRFFASAQNDILLAVFNKASEKLSIDAVASV